MSITSEHVASEANPAPHLWLELPISGASHFMMNGGNILNLQRILGHGSLTMTMRYAHLAPEHPQEAKNINPFARLTLQKNLLSNVAI